MNVWTLYKHKSIKIVMIRLQSQLGLEHFRVQDEDNRDFFSIALINPKQPEIRAYVYTYGQRREQYGLHLEFPLFAENDLSDSFQVYDGLSINQVIDTLATHFDVASYEVAV